MNILKKLTLLTLGLVLFIGCTNDNKKIVLRLGHNHTVSNPSHLALQSFAHEVEAMSNGEITIKIFPNGVLGDDRTMIEQCRQGILDFVRVNSGTLENFDSNYAIFSMPYLFKNEEHFKRIMNSEIMERIYLEAAEDSKLRGLTYQDTGVRSFYMKSGPINSPSDLKGKKIRVISSKNSIRMMDLLGGVATLLPYGEIYTGLQQGVIDGGENNPQALTLDKHGEVAKFYSLDEHLRMPDFLVISEKRFAKLSPDHQHIIKTAAVNSTNYHNELWAQAIEASIKEAQDRMGVTINSLDQEPFKALVEPMYQELEEKNPALAALVGEFRS